MARRSAKAARKKDAKRQRAAEKRAQRARNRAMSPDNSSPLAAGRRLLLLKDAVVKGETPAPRGLVNLGNTCFFNAVMQNLSRIAPFRDYFVGTPPCPGEGPMTTALRAFFIAMWDLNTSSVFDPSNLFTQVGKNNPTFKGRAQQDSHELMRVVFDAVIEEEKKRLTNVARGILPPSLSPDTSDDSSENDVAHTVPSDDCPDEHYPSDPAIQLASQSEPLSDPEAPVIPSPPQPAESDTASLASTAICNDTPAEPDTEDASSDDDEIPLEKLVSVIEYTVGGTLSSTIECKECGTRSSVVEPFLDLQLPLVPRDEAETKARASQTLKGKASKAASCLKLRSDPAANSDSEQKTRDDTGDSKIESQIAPSAPAPPPPPPLPAPPRPLEAVADASTITSCDVMRQLRETVTPSEPEPDLEPEPIPENRLIVYTGDTIIPNPPTDTEAVFDDGDDSEECGFLSSLFDDDLDDPTDSAIDDISNMNAFSTSEAARTDITQLSSAEAPKKTATPPPVRKTPSFIASLFGGLSGVSAAPHGYRPVTGSLEEFTKVEVLEGDNAYGCEECTRSEKLRAALQARTKLKMVSKKHPRSYSQVEGRKEQPEMESSSPIESDDGVPSVTELENGSTLASDQSLASEVRVGQGDDQVLMSSPVTSSESSSGVSSEDDGELIIEEELEDAPVNTEPVLELTREQEDEIIKQFNVKLPSVRTTAEKRLLIRDAPNVLALQLKRFTQVGYRGGLRKISGHVEYPLSLDMTSFVEEAVSKSHVHSEKNKKADVAKRKRNSHEACEKREKYEYLLIGVVVHGGSLTGGHYTAYVREGVEPNTQGGWYFCNDSKISRASEKDVLNSEAYLLYYERITI